MTDRENVATDVHTNATEDRNMMPSESFDDIKEVAYKNISEMLRDLQAFETAIQEENIPEIYRIYQGKLHKELKETSNQNHEIDELLVKKLHDQFTTKFPFMRHVEKISPTMNYYQIGEYYHERATIAVDANEPAIFVMPTIEQNWQQYDPSNAALLTDLEKRIDEIDANAIAAQTELARLDEELEKIQQEQEKIENEKSFFNRLKIDEEIEELMIKAEFVESKRQEWLPYFDRQTQNDEQKEQLRRQYQYNRLKQAIVAKEHRQIARYFGDVSSMYTQFDQFLAEYLKKDSQGGMKHDE